MDGGTRDILIDRRDEPLDDKDFPGIFHVGKGESIIHSANMYHLVPIVSARGLLVRRTFSAGARRVHNQTESSELWSVRPE